MSDKNQPFSILFVCLGNIIRSPTCEGLLRTLVQPSVLVDSAACTRGDLGQSPAEHAETICKEHGFDISSHVSRLITDDDFRKFDLIVSLEHYVHTCLEEMRPPGSRASIVEFVPGKDIDNPWWAPYEQFERMYAQIEAGMGPFIKKHIPQHLQK
jgi:protein-tyrosine phosphatase